MLFVLPGGHLGITTFETLTPARHILFNILSKTVSSLHACGVFV